MSELVVTGPGLLTLADKTYQCALGRSGIRNDKHEGDGATPVGILPLREVWYRADRIEKPVTHLLCREIMPTDIWCDDPASELYNQHVSLLDMPDFSASHEKMWREDHVYDVIVPMGWNDQPVTPGKGSAIFMHIARDEYTPTEGCIALALEDMLELLASATNMSAVVTKHSKLPQ